MKYYLKKLKIHIFITIVCFAVIMIFGLCAKQAHKDLNCEDNPIDDFYVALLPDELLSNQLNIMSESLDENPYILEVICRDEMNFKFSCATQQVEVKKVFRGDGLQSGDMIEILKSNSIFPELDSDKAILINMGFVNEMSVGDSYLVFLDEKTEVYDGMAIYSNNYCIAPIFSYSNHKQEFHQPEDLETCSVRYSTVKEDEFFLMSQWAVEEMNEFKQGLLFKYPQ